MDERLLKLLVLCVSLLFCFLAVEGTVRLLLGQQSGYAMNIYASDENLGWKLEPGVELLHRAPTGEYAYFIRVNSRGERGAETTIKDGNYTVLVVGDSMTFGQGVEEDEIFFNSIKEVLPDAVVLNAGVGGYNTVQELDVVEKYVAEYGVDFVVLGFFAGNDVVGESSSSYVVENGFLTPPKNPFDLKETIKRNVKSVTFTVELIRSVPYLSPLKEFLEDCGILHKTKSPVFQGVLEVPPPDYMEEGWLAVEKQFERMQAIGKREGIVFFVVDMPNLYQVNDGLRAEHFNPDKNYSIYYPGQRLAEIAGGKPNIVLVSVLKEFRESKEDLFFPFDPHWNARGHAIAGNVLAERVLEIYAG